MHVLLTPVASRAGLHGWSHRQDPRPETTAILRSSCSLALGSQDCTSASRRTRADNRDKTTTSLWYHTHDNHADVYISV